MLTVRARDMETQKRTRWPHRELSTTNDDAQARKNCRKYLITFKMDQERRLCDSKLCSDEEFFLCSRRFLRCVGAARKKLNQIKIFRAEA